MTSSCSHPIRLRGWQERIEPISARDLLPRFRLDTIPPHSFVLTPELLHKIGYRR